LYVIKKIHNNKVVHKIGRLGAFHLGFGWNKMWMMKWQMDPWWRKINSGSNLRDPLKSRVWQFLALGLVCVCMCVCFEISGVLGIIQPVGCGQSVQSDDISANVWNMQIELLNHHGCQGPCNPMISLSKIINHLLSTHPSSTILQGLALFYFDFWVAHQIWSTLWVVNFHMQFCKIHFWNMRDRLSLKWILKKFWSKSPSSFIDMIIKISKSDDMPFLCVWLIIIELFVKSHD
jgi:hypothetical protein